MGQRSSASCELRAVSFELRERRWKRLLAASCWLQEKYKVLQRYTLHESRNHFATKIKPAARGQQLYKALTLLLRRKRFTVKIKPATSSQKPATLQSV
jgi:hypothetical protein